MLLLFAVCCAPAAAQQSDAATGDADLAASQARLAERYERLEVLAGRLSEVSRSTQPRRARLLRDLIAAGREEDLPGLYDRVLVSLERGKLGPASSRQAKLTAELEKLLNMLLEEDRGRQIDSERKRIAKYLAELNRIIRMQRGVIGGTEGGAESKELSKEQRDAAAEAGKLAESIDRDDAQRGSTSPAGESGPGESDEGKESAGEKPGGEPSEGAAPGEPSEGEPESGEPGEGQPGEGSPGQGSPGGPSPEGSEQSEAEQPPTQKANQQLQAARRRMQQAAQELEEGRRTGALDKQRDALKKLAEAKKELERILRQLREEEMERMLVMLEARFRKMLEDQIAVYKRTQALEEGLETVPTHEMEISASRLSRKQTAIARDAERALLLLREDGTSVAFPEAIELAKEDMEEVAGRLQRVLVGAITQGIEEDIIESLEEAVAALRQALKELDEKKGQPQPGGGGDQEQELVNQLAELRMIRGLQMRVNRRTQRYARMIEGEATDKSELVDALQRLAVRQERIFEATRDLHTGANR
ncbi:MAG: hypothetical protein AAGA92_08850 [Planctomycetota bacterium]